MKLFQGLSRNLKNLSTQLFGTWQVQQDPALYQQDYNNEDTINKVLLSSFFNIKDTKEGIINDINSLKDFYFSQMIVDRIMDDALNPSGNSQNLFSVSVKNSEDEEDESATKLLKDFIDDFSLQKAIKDIGTDLLYYGEYILRLDTVSIDDKSNSQSGIINIHDDVDLTNVLPVFRDSDISYYLKLGEKKLEIVQPTEFVYFCMPSNRVKIKINGLDDKIAYLRMGKSVLYPIFGLLKEMKFFETLVPMGFVKDALRTKLVGVSVPSSTKPGDAQKIAKTFQKLINNTLMVTGNKDSDEEAILKNISSKVGEVKVIPTWGDKGDLASQDFSSDSDYDAMFDKITDMRKMALTTIGIPAGIIDEQNIKSDVIKDNIRYSKKLKTFQSALKEGLQRLFIIHLANKGFNNFVKEDIEISFLNTLSVDELEKLEYVDLMISMLDNFQSFVGNFDDNENLEVNWEGYVGMMNSQFSNVLGFDLFKLKEKDSNNSNDDSGE